MIVSCNTVFMGYLSKLLRIFYILLGNVDIKEGYVTIFLSLLYQIFKLVIYTAEVFRYPFIAVH